jgi:hypothetical protein
MMCAFKKFESEKINPPLASYQPQRIIVGDWGTNTAQLKLHLS